MTTRSDFPAVPSPRLLARYAACALALATASAHAQIGLGAYGAPADGSVDPLNDRFGVALANLGDLDHDGHDELAVAAENWSFLGGSAGGWVTVYSGRERRPMYSVKPNVSSTFELALAAVGDVDGDERTDFALGCPYDDTDGLTNNGSVWIYSGRSGALIRRHVGGDLAEHLGAAVSGAGDVNHDGRADYAAGAPNEDVPLVGVDAGCARIWSGSNGAFILQKQGEQPQARLGTSLAELGDCDGDGRPDLAVGSPGDRRVYVIAAGQLPYFASGNNGVVGAFVGFGASVVNAGDVDGDGLNDFAVGAPDFDGWTDPFTGEHFDWIPNAGAVVLCKGSTGQKLDYHQFNVENARWGSVLARVPSANGLGTAAIGVVGLGNASPYTYGTLSRCTPDLAQISTAGFSGPHFGAAALCHAGDLDGDGESELWLGRPYEDGQATDAGEVQRYEFGPNSGSLAKLHSGDGLSYGHSVALLDDLDGDGKPELIVGAPFARSASGLLDAGRVRVYSGVELLYDIAGLELDQAGWCVGAAGDVDGDGVGDFAFGSPNANAQGRRGALSIWSGASGTPIIKHFGSQVGDRHGSSFAGLGDVNGDGVPDYATGAPGASSAGIEAGRVRAYSGATLSTLWTVDGQNASELFGSALAPAGDLNGDGRVDLLAGAPRASQQIQTFAGRVDARSGANGGLLHATHGPSFDALYGAAVAGVGDLSGDAIPDYVVGAPGHDSFGVDNGRVQLRSGANGAALWHTDGSVAGRWGSSVAGLGDVTNDGVPDFSAGGPYATGANAFLVRAGAVRAYSGKTKQAHCDWFGTQEEEHFGAALAGAALGTSGDLELDGMPDLIAGAPGRDGNSFEDVGRALSLSARSIGTFPYGPGTPGCTGTHYLTLLDPLAPGVSTELRSSGLVPGVIPMLALSFGADMAGSNALGLGALVHVNLAQLVLVQTLQVASGTHNAKAVALPASSTLTGSSIYAQEAYVWPGGCASLPLSISSSRGLRINVQ